MLYLQSKIQKISLLRVIIGMVILIGTILYIIDVSMLPRCISISIIKTLKNDWNWEIERVQQELEWDSSYFVNEIGCKMPSFPVYGKNIEKFLTTYKSPVECAIPLTKTDFYSLWISLNETELDIYYNVTDAKELNCSYTPMYRQTENDVSFDESKTKYFVYGETVTIDDHFIKVVCKNSTGGIIYSDYHVFFQKVSPNSVRNSNSSKFKPNILLIGFDSMSRLNLHRQMNKSVSVLLDQLKAIEFFGYNKVEDNTYPNLIPVLTGLDKNEIEDACVPFQNSSFDQCHYIWDNYKAQNYSTVFAEDTAWLGLFNYCRGGFKKQPTDYCLRPLIRQLEKDKLTKRVMNTFFCLGYKDAFDLFIEYITKFLHGMGTQEYFSFFWTSTFTHDDWSSPQLIDERFAEFLLNLPSLVTNNTIVIVMSDHGVRYGSFRNTYQGSIEERQNCLYVIPPASFPLLYPNAVKNMLKNRRQLTTHFDLHQTLYDLTDVDMLTNEAIQQRSRDLLETEAMPRGISLFLPIPSSRTCSLAGIPPHFCTCHDKQVLNTSDSRVTESARLIVDRLNEIVKPFPQCQPLSLNTISNANILATNSKIKSEDNSQKFQDVTINLETVPGLAMFEATVRVFNDSSKALAGVISRLNLYGKQSQCVDDYEVKLYCFCKSFL